MKKNSPHQLTNHHRKSIANGGKSNANNISRVTRERHEAFHLLFERGNLEFICNELNTVWVDPAYKITFTKK